MPLPLLDFPLKSQNNRVQGFEVAGDEQEYIYSMENLYSPAEVDDLIAAAYRQVFHEQQMLKFNRQTYLESQLRNGQMTVRQFIRGLATSYPFRSNNYNANSNYRFVQLCVQRLLGRDIYNEREAQAWSIVLATQGLEGFINSLLGSDEYEANFGEDVVPYQRRRILPQRGAGEISFEHMPRYAAEYRVRREAMGCMRDFSKVGGSSFGPYKPSKALTLVGASITYAGAAILLGLVVAVALAALGIISL